jgi:sugar phosphate isomerase/epimerase
MWKRAADGGLELQPRTFGEPPTNYPAFVKALVEIGYKGYLCYEFCHPALNERHEPAGIEKVDEQAQFAMEYMRKVLLEAVR